MNDNLATVWEAVAEVRGPAPALVQGRRRITWAELAQRAGRLACALAGYGVGPGANVGLCLWNAPEYLEATWAAFALGATPVNLNVRYRADELAAVIEDGDAAVVIHDWDLGPAMSQVASRQPAVRAWVAVGRPPPGSDLPSGPLGVLAFEDLVASGPCWSTSDGRGRRSGDDVFMIYTGGTTGRPKGVRWRHRDLAGWLAYPAYEANGRRLPAGAAAAARVAAEAAGAGEAPVTLPACPLVHGTAFFFSVSALMLGGTVVLLESRSTDVDQLWRSVEIEQVTQMVMVGDVQGRPAVDGLDRAAGAGRPYDVSSLRRVFSSGLIWTAEVKAGLARHCPDATMIDMLGSSEGGPFGIDLVEPGSTPTTGRFRLSHRAAVLGDDGTPVAPGSGQIGRLAITAPIPLGYHKDPIASAQTFPTYSGVRWSIPGDHAVLEADGTVVLLGRGSACINTGGEKVWPEEVELAVRSHPAVDDCVVVGIPDPRWGQAVAAVIALRSGAIPADAESLGASPTDAELVRWVRSRLAGYKVPKAWCRVGEVERGPAGKADYAWAAQVAAGQAPAAGTGAGPKPDRARTRDSSGRPAASVPPSRE